MAFIIWKGNRESVLQRTYNLSFVEPREKARSYEESFSVHTTYNRYVQKAIKHWFKSNAVKKTRRNQDETKVFRDRIVVSARKSVTQLKQQKAGDTGDWVVEKSNKPRYQENELVALDPFRTEANLYHLVHHDDTKSCPPKFTRCKILFTNAYIVLIKTKEKTQFSCPKTGKERCHAANVYLHYL